MKKLIIYLSAVGILGSILLKLNTKYEGDKRTEYFQTYIKSIKSHDSSKFMDFQNHRNPLFYKEQHRWIQEVIHKEGQRFIFEPSIKKIEILNRRKGLLYLRLKIIRPSGREKTYTVKYTIKKNWKGKWLLDDYPFLEMQRNHLCINFFEDNRHLALMALDTGSEIVNIYRNKFGWQPTHINVKVYHTLDQISVSIPWFAIYGWSEENESIKLLVPDYAEDEEKVFVHMLSHELSHKMLSALTNDNASLYLQEGLATYLEKSIVFSDYQIDFLEQKTAEHIHDVLRNVNHTLLSLPELNKLTYNDGYFIYNHGFLLVYFLLQAHGIKKFVHLIKLLEAYDYIDRRIHQKLKRVNCRTFKSLEAIYGDYTSLHNEMRSFYKGYKVRLH